jgi:hypothetical protein
MLDFVIWSVVVGLMPAAAALMWALIFFVSDLIGSIIAGGREGKARQTFTSRPGPDPSSSAIWN